jgi:CRP-like cAMP-binding protein
LDIIRKLELRSPLSTDEKSALRATFATVRTFDRDQDLLTDGEHPAFVGALLEGFICRQKALAAGQRQIVSFPLPGDIFDLNTFVVERMDHTVSALTRCRVAVASHAAVRTLTETYPRLGAMLWRDAIVEGSVFREWVVNCGRRNARERTAHLFCELAVRMTEVGLANGQSYPLPLTQANLSDATGLSVVHVNRVVQQLRADKLISLAKGRLTIHDWNGLALVGGFRAGYLHSGDKARARWPFHGLDQGEGDAAA